MQSPDPYDGLATGPKRAAMAEHKSSSAWTKDLLAKQSFASSEAAEVREYMTSTTSPMLLLKASSDRRHTHRNGDNRINAALRYLRTTPHRLAGRSRQAKTKALAVVELMKADEILRPSEGPTDVSKNLDSYLYGTNP